MPKRVMSGVIVSAKNPKTVTVKVTSSFLHPVYGKTVKKSKKYAAHCLDENLKEGDAVRIIESAPFSKTKKWLVLSNNAI